LAGKSKNAYTDAILAVIDEYKTVVKDTEKPEKQTPKVMEETIGKRKTPFLPGLASAIEQENIRPRTRSWLNA